MAKESGIGMTAAIDDGSGASQVSTGDITDLSINLPRANQDVTSIDLSGVERILLLADLSLGLSGVFNDAADRAHAVFKTVPSQSSAQLRAVSIAISAQTFTAETMPQNYDLTRASGGAFTWAVTLVNGDGIPPSWS